MSKLLFNHQRTNQTTYYSPMVSFLRDTSQLTASVHPCVEMGLSSPTCITSWLLSSSCLLTPQSQHLITSFCNSPQPVLVFTAQYHKRILTPVPMAAACWVLPALGLRPWILTEDALPATAAHNRMLSQAGGRGW